MTAESVEDISGASEIQNQFVWSRMYDTINL